MRAREIFERSAVQPDLSKVKKDITSKVNAISDIDELHQIYSYVRKIDIGAGFDELFSKDPDLKQVQNILSQIIVDAKGSFDDKMAFAKEMVNPGIIDTKKLLTPGLHQNILDVVVTKYPNIFEQVAPTLLNISGAFAAGDKKTNKGKGEFFFALCSPKIKLSAGKGDIIVNNKHIEVKANLARMTGRKGYGSTDNAYNQTEKNVREFLSKHLPKVKAPVFKVTLGAKSNLWSAFGPFCIQNGVKSNIVIDFLKSQLKDIIKSLYLNLNSSKLNALAANISSAGVLNFSTLYPMVKTVAFEYYQNSDGFEGIIFINAATGDFTYVNSGEQFQQSIKTKKLGFETGTQNGMQIVI